ncbi:MAG TPA: helix-turn-helix transcriptional regulator [Thermoanaerobaculia bacterium]
MSDSDSSIGDVFGRRLRELRLAYGLTQAQLAASCETSISGISKLEGGKTSPTLATLVRLADAIGCTVAELIESVDIARRESSRGVTPPAKNPSAVTLGRLGGSKGGKVRAEKLTPEARKQIASQAARARWSKPKPGSK